MALAGNAVWTPGRSGPGVQAVPSPLDHSVGATPVSGDTVEDEVVLVSASTLARADGHRSVDAARPIPVDVPPTTVGTSEAGVDRVPGS